MTFADWFAAILLLFLVLFTGVGLWQARRRKRS